MSTVRLLGKGNPYKAVEVSGSWVLVRGDKSGRQGWVPVNATTPLGAGSGGVTRPIGALDPDVYILVVLAALAVIGTAAWVVAYLF